MIRAEVQAGSWTGCFKARIASNASGLFVWCSRRLESVMERKHEAKNDFFYAFVMFAIFAVVVFHVAAEFFHRYPEAYLVDFGEAVETRVMVAEADAHAVVAVRAA
jgi:hypothetical protein